MADIKKVIEEVMTGVHSKGALIKMRMGEFGPFDEGSTWAEKQDYKRSSSFKFKPVASYNMVYDAPQNQLEPIYYWILDFLNNMMKVKKITDNFTSSPGSGHFAEMGQRATRLQDEGMKIIGILNQTVRSALNLVYDLKEFRMRIQNYDDLHSDDKKLSEGAMLALKQVWLDSVDMPKRQTGSIHQMTAQLGYTTLRDVFMIADDLDSVDKLAKDDEGPINEQVVRIVKPRLKEFFDWLKYSESELRKRYSIEKSYLKSQIGTIKLYNGWVKPYLTAVEELRQKGFDDDAALVNAFSTSMFQLTLMGTGRGGKSKKREYSSIVIVDFRYRGHLLQRANQRGDYAAAVGGRVEMTFDCYALNNEELELIEKKMTESNMKDALTIEGDYATESIDELEKDLREFLEEEDVDKMLKKEKKKEKKKNVDDINPFSALLDIFNLARGRGGKVEKKDGKVVINDVKDIKTDNWKEKQLRMSTATGASKSLYTVYDVYKKAHGMASTPTEFLNAGGPVDPGEMSTSFSETMTTDWK
jgi:hypothetical protein